MKGFTKMLSSVLLLLVTCQAAPVSASCMHSTKHNLPCYQNVITDISLGYEDAMLAGTIVINDGEILRVLDYKTRDDNVMKTWKKGDVLSLDAHVKDDGLVLVAKRLNTPNPDEVKPYVIFDVVESQKTGLKIVEVNEHGEYIKLSDDSVWKFGWYSGLSTKTWKLGERVLVEGQGDSNSYSFINLDAPIAKNAASATATFVAH